MLEEAADLWASHSHAAPATHDDDDNDTDTDHIPSSDAHDDAYSDTDGGAFRQSAEGNSEADSVFNSFSDWDRRSLLSLSSEISASNSGRPPMGSLSTGHITNSAAASVAAVPLAPQATAAPQAPAAPQATAAISATDTIKQLEASAAQAAYCLRPLTLASNHRRPLLPLLL